MTDFNVSFVGRDDQADLADLMLQANHHYWGENPGAQAMTQAAAHRIADGSAGCRAVVGRLGDAPVAFATFAILLPSLSEHGTLFMKDLYVSQSARGEGIGKRMMAFLAEFALEEGCRRFDWTAETDNPGALGFYDGLAAERVTEKVYFRFSGEDLTRMAKG